MPANPRYNVVDIRESRIVHGDLTVLGDIIGTVSGVLNNYSATVPPGVNDDTTLGYAVGSEWIDVVAGRVYRAVDVTAGAADWPETSNVGASVGTMAFQDSDAVNITGGTIDGTPIGTITKAVGNFTTSQIDTLSLTNDLAIVHGGTGASTASAARTALGVDPAGTDNSTDVSLVGSANYLSLVGQVLTQDPITESDISDLQSYKLDFSENSGFNLNLGTSASTVSEGDHTHVSEFLRTLTAVSETFAKGDFGYVTASGVIKTNADAVAQATRGIVVAAEAVVSTESGLFQWAGVMTGLTGLTEGIQYLTLTDGEIGTTAPSGSGEIVRVAGYAESTTVLFINPSSAWVEIV